MVVHCWVVISPYWPAGHIYIQVEPLRNLLGAGHDATHRFCPVELSIYGNDALVQVVKHLAVAGSAHDRDAPVIGQ